MLMIYHDGLISFGYHRNRLYFISNGFALLLLIMLLITVCVSYVVCRISYIVCAVPLDGLGFRSSFPVGSGDCCYPYLNGLCLCLCLYLYWY